MNRSTGIVLSTIICLVLAGCGGWDDVTPTVEATATPTAQATPPPAFTPTSLAPDSTRSSSDAILPTPRPEVFSDALIGSSRVESEPGTVRDADGNPPDVELPGIDLLAVEIEGNGTELWVYWHTTARAPSSVERGQIAVWAVEIWMDGRPLYDLVVRFEFGNRQILIVDRETGEEAVLHLATIFATHLEAPYWGYLLPKLTGPFQWMAYASWTDASGQTWTERVPDVDGSEPTDEWGTFPES